MIGFSTLSLITFCGGVQGLVLVLAIARIKNPNRFSNRILSVLIFLISCTLLGQLIYSNNGAFIGRFPEVPFVIDMPLMVFGPLVFLYVSTLLDKGSVPSWKWCYHFVPALLHNVHLWRYVLEPREAIMQRFESGNFPVARYVVVFASIQIAVYLALALRAVLRFEKQSLKERSIRPGLGYIKLFLGMIGLCWLAWFLGGLRFVVPQVEVFHFLTADVAWILMAMTTSFLAFFAMSQKDVLRLTIDPKKYEGSLLTVDQHEGLRRRLTECMMVEKPHLEGKLTLQELASKMESNPKDLSQVINQGFGQNFFDFVNAYRVEEFKRLATLERLENETLLAIAFEAGFNSKSTFNAAFKKITGITPIQFTKGKGLSGAGSGRPLPSSTL